MKVFVPYLLTLLCAAGVTAALLPLLRRYAARLFMDQPGGPLKKHAHATPVVGGIAVFAGTWTALVALRLLTAFPSGTLRTLRGVLIGGTLIFFMGLVDDLKDPVKIEHELRKILPPEHSSDFCHCIVLHGRAVCDARKPDCANCCVKHLCKSFSG